MTHYEQRMEADLEALKSRVARQGEAVGRALHDATRALVDLDLPLAARTMLGDHPINRAAREIDRRCHAFVARHVPSAGHLRFVSAVMRMNIALERIGDYAVTICREVSQMREKPPQELVEDIELMSGHGRNVLVQAMRAFQENNAELARGTMALARQQARTFHTVFHDLLREGEQGTRRIEDLFGLLVVLYRLERVGDQARNLCEDIIFIATGETKRPKVYQILFVDEAAARWAPMAVAIARKGFPESGTYRGAGWQPAPAADPRVAAFLDRRGLETQGAPPERIPTAYDDLSAFHVIVGLEGDVRAHLPEVPFHTVVLQWDVLEGGVDPADERQLEEFQRRLSHRIRELMETLRGEGAA